MFTTLETASLTLLLYSRGELEAESVGLRGALRILTELQHCLDHKDKQSLENKICVLHVLYLGKEYQAYVTFTLKVLLNLV